MKDSFGGTIMIYILIFFLGIYIVFIALTLRYAQAFKTKNRIIEIIEQEEGVPVGKRDPDVKNRISGHLDAVGIPYDRIEIERIDNNDLKNTCYYKVKTSIEWEWPFFDLEGNWIITGETRNVKKCGDISYDAAAT